MVKKCFVLHEEFIDDFQEILHFHNKKLSFHLAHAMIIGSMEFGNTRNIFFHDNSSEIYIKLKKYSAEKSAKQPV